jgi:hypothetical protein
VVCHWWPIQGISGIVVPHLSVMTKYAEVVVTLSHLALEYWGERCHPPGAVPGSSLATWEGAIKAYDSRGSHAA